jgi:hypothetical protein
MMGGMIGEMGMDEMGAEYLGLDALGLAWLLGCWVEEPDLDGQKGGTGGWGCGFGRYNIGDRRTACCHCHVMQETQCNTLDKKSGRASGSPTWLLDLGCLTWSESGKSSTYYVTMWQ